MTARRLDADWVRFEDLNRCFICGAHVIGEYEPVNVTAFGEPERWVRGGFHVCSGYLIESIEPGHREGQR